MVNGKSERRIEVSDFHYAITPAWHGVAMVFYGEDGYSNTPFFTVTDNY